MAEAIADILSALLIRLRDPGGASTSRALATDILARSQQYYNESLRLKLTSTSFATLPWVQLYPLTDDLGLLSVSHITHQNRDLFHVTVQDLHSIDRTWHRASSSRYECFVPLGFTHVLLWPARPVADTVTLIGPTKTVALTSETQTLELSQERTPLLIQLTELILLNRLQDDTAFNAVMRNFVKFLPQEMLRESRSSANA